MPEVHYRNEGNVSPGVPVDVRIDPFLTPPAATGSNKDDDNQHGNIPIRNYVKPTRLRRLIDALFKGSGSLKE